MRLMWFWVLAALAIGAAAQTALTIPPQIHDAVRLGDPYDNVAAVGFDGKGNMYVMGTVYAAGPPPSGVTQVGPTCAGCSELFVAKISGGELVHMTWIGGVDCENCQLPNSATISVDWAGDVYFAGLAGPDFLTTPGVFQRTSANGGVYLLKLDPTGTALVFATFAGSEGNNVATYGGYPTTYANALAVDANGNAYVVGSTDGVGFPTTLDAFQQAGSLAGVVWHTGFVAKFDPAGNLLASTLFGGTQSQDVSEITSVGVDGAGEIHVAGRIEGVRDFPTTPDGTAWSWNTFGFLATLDSKASQLVYSTALQNRVDAMRVSAAGDAFVEQDDGEPNETIARIDAHGAVVYQAPSPVEFDGSMLLWGDGTLLIAGSADSPSAATKDTLQPCAANTTEPSAPITVFWPSGALAALDPNGHLWFSTLLGGSRSSSINSVALKPGGYVYLAGGGSPDFPGGPLLAGDDTYRTGFAFNLDLSTLPSGLPSPACLAKATDGGFAPAAPGTVMTVYGSNLGPAAGVSYQPQPGGIVPGELAGTSVTVGDLPAPVVYAQANQVTFVMPQKMDTPATDICFATAAGKNCIYAEVTPGLLPGVFYVLNQDGTTNSGTNPAPRGTTVSVYGTGMGPYDEVLPDGTVAVSSPPALLTTPISAEFTGVPFCTPIGCSGPPPANAIAAIYYAGAVPGMVLGYWRLDVAVVQNAPTFGTTLQLTFGTPTPIVIQVPISIT